MKTDVVFATPWFELVAKTVREGEEPYYSLRLADYAAVVALTTENRVLLVRQFRAAIERDTIELPSGIVDPGETAAGTAARELREETGYEAAEVETLGRLTVDNGRMSNSILACFAKDVRRVAGPEPGIQVLDWSIPELMQGIRDGEFNHALHVAIVMLAVTHGKLQGGPGGESAATSRKFPDDSDVIQPGETE